MLLEIFFRKNLKKNHWERHFKALDGAERIDGARRGAWREMVRSAARARGVAAVVGGGGASARPRPAVR